jgi:hypothetical protein
MYTVDTSLCLSIWIQAFMEYDLLPQEPWWCGSVHIEHQSKALHLSYLTTCASSTPSFASASLRTLYRDYTGHSSILPLFLAPKRLAPALVNIPQLAHPASILTFLPIMNISTRWPSHVYMQLPAKLVFLSPGRRPNPEPACSWSPLAADFLHWSLDYGFILRQPLSKVNGRQAQQLVKAWTRCDIAAIPALNNLLEIFMIATMTQRS